MRAKRYKENELRAKRKKESSRAKNYTQI